MFDLAVLVAFVLAAGALILSPGPDTIYVLARSVSDGRAAGVASAAGIAAGVLVHTLGAVVGLSALFRASELAFAAVTYVGAAYLAYLGVRTIRDDGLRIDTAGPDGEVGEENGGATGPFLEAATVNVLNPQVAVFFLAFLPQFATGGDRIELQLASLGAIYATLTACYLGAVAVASSAVRRGFSARPWLGTAVRWVTGTVLVGLGLRLFVLGAGP